MMIKLMMDQEFYGVEEYWVILIIVGDCEDYVFLKCKFLYDVGVFYFDLLMIVVLQLNGEGYVVFMVCIDCGDFVFDNMCSKVLFWLEIEYCFFKCQVIDNFVKWVKFDDGCVIFILVGMFC